MSSIHDHVALSAGKQGFTSRVAEAVARILQDAVRHSPDPSSEVLPPSRGNNQLREDIGLLPIDRNGLPM